MPLGGQMWPAGRHFDMPALNISIFVRNFFLGIFYHVYQWFSAEEFSTKILLIGWTDFFSRQEFVFIGWSAAGPDPKKRLPSVYRW